MPFCGSMGRTLQLRRMNSGNKVILSTEDERQVCLECTNDSVKINVEERMITDTKLKNEWGNVMYRITYTISAPNSANFNLKIS